LIFKAFFIKGFEFLFNILFIFMLFF